MIYTFVISTTILLLIWVSELFRILNDYTIFNSIEVYHL